MTTYITCSPGYYKNAYSYSCYQCQAGKYSGGGTAIYETAISCQTCSAGSYSLAGASSCSYCLPGTYSNTAGATSSSSCLPCLAGTYSGGGSSYCEKCPLGTYSTTFKATSSTVCQSCPAGTSSNTSGAYALSNCQTCSAGTYAATRSSYCETCPVGSYSTNGASSCTKCSPGKYSNVAGATSCQTCLAGTYAVSNAYCEVCPAGKYSLDGSSSCSNCAAGTYSSTIGATSSTTCLTCSPGTFSGPGASSCESCPAGMYPPATGTACQFCPIGTYSLGGSVSCSNCTAGTYSSTTGAAACTPCDAGKYSSVERATSCSNVCPIGTYSSSGAASCTKCSAGTYSSRTGTAVCTPCDAGKYSSVEGATSCSNVCPAGTYSTGGAASCTPCYPGFYFAGTNGTSSSVCQRCPYGTYNPYYGRESCTTCPYGLTTSRTGVQNVNGCVCPAGMTKTVFNTCEGEPCPTGTYYANARTISDGSSTVYLQAGCYSCPGGTYNDQLGKYWSCDNCPAGTYSNERSSECTICPPGYVSNLGSNACTICSAGTYSSYDRKTCVPCPTGQYSPEGAEFCTTECPYPYVKPIDSSAACVTCKGTINGQNCDSCPTGYVYSGTPSNLTSVSCKPCPIGYYYDFFGEDVACYKCPDGTTTRSEGSIWQSSCLDPTPCGLGQYMVWAMYLGQMTKFCYDCGGGTYGDGISCIGCKAGTFSPLYSPTARTSCTPCGKGTYSMFDSAYECTYCEAGTYSNIEGATSCSNVCPAGTYSTYGAISCTKCPQGTYFAGSRGTSSSVCQKCPRGTYNSLEGQSSCTQCPPNTGTLTGVEMILSTGLTVPSSRTNGEGSTSLSNCMTCPVNQTVIQGVCMYCPPGFEYDSNGNCKLCPRGTYNDTSARFGGYCKSCPANRWQTANEGSSSFDDCLVICQNNQKFNKTSNVCEWCQAGYYSDTYTSCQACPNGTFLDMRYRSDSRISPLCQACPTGQTNTGTGNTTCYCAAGYTKDSSNNCVECQSGYYSGYGASQCTPCPAGTYFPGTRGESISVCLPCENASLCPLGSSRPQCPLNQYLRISDYTCQSCPIGYYSPQGSIGIEACLHLPCGPGQTWDEENGVCVFKDLSLSCTDVSNPDDCINPSYSGNNAAKVDIKNYVYGNEPTTFIDKSVLPQALQDVLGTCDSQSCQLVAADFSTQTFTSENTVPYVINTLQSTNENKAAVVRSGADEPVVFMSPPGFSMSQYSIGEGTRVAIPVNGVSNQDSCALACVSNDNCKGFNLNTGSNSCEFYTSINTDEDTYIDSKVSFRKETVQSSAGLLQTLPPGTNLGNQGSFCRDVVKCNTDIIRVIERTNIPYFVTTELEACEYCPPRKYHRASSIYTNELGMSLRYNTLVDILYQIGPGATHTRFFQTDVSYIIRPYKNQGVFSDRTLTLSVRVVDETFTDASLNTDTVQTPTALWNLIPCDYVNDGFLLQRTDTLRYFTNAPLSDTNTAHYISSVDKYTDSYNYAIWIITGQTSTSIDNIPPDVTVTPTFEWNTSSPYRQSNLGLEIGAIVLDTIQPGAGGMLTTIYDMATTNSKPTASAIKGMIPFEQLGATGSIVNNMIPYLSRDTGTAPQVTDMFTNQPLVSSTTNMTT